MARRRWLWWTAVAVLVLPTTGLAVVTVNVAAAVRDRAPDRSAAVRDELRALRAALDDGAGERMQGLFPEGYLFMHGLHGLAWADLAHAGQADGGEARGEAQRAAERLDSPAGKAPFPATLEPPRGVFYSGWSLLLRARLAGLPGAEDASGDARLAADADRLAAAFAANLDRGASPFLEAYAGQSWPVDSVVAMAALRETDRAVGTDHAALIDRWRARAGELVDPATGLLPHVSEPGTGRLIEGARGTSQAIIQRFWPAVDPGGAPASYRSFRDRFVTSVVGAVGVREYPPGVDGTGDVDSGPLVLGLSASATAVALGAARANGDPGLAAALTQEVEVFGLRHDGRYLFGRLAVADAFAAWARATPMAAGGPLPGPVVWWPALLVAAWIPLAAAWAALVGGALRRRARDDRGRRPAPRPTGAARPPAPDRRSCT